MVAFANLKYCRIYVYVPQRRLEAITCASSGMQLAMLSDDVKKASRAERSKNSLSASKFSSFQSKIARI